MENVWKLLIYCDSDIILGLICERKKKNFEIPNSMQLRSSKGKI